MDKGALHDALKGEVGRRFALETVSRDGAHDLGHVERVARHAVLLAVEEGADVTVCLAAAWLHDLVYLPKNHPDAASCGDRAAIELPVVCGALGLEHHAKAIALAVSEHSFSAGRRPSSLEAAVLQDADRLDAIGAIGIARCFATSGSMGGALFHDEDPFAESGRPLDDKAFALDHFERKLLALAAGMNTQAGRARAMVRQETMVRFLDHLRVELRSAPTRG